VTGPLVAAQAAVFAAFGLVVGSFLTVVVYRIPRKMSLVRPRSACPGCGMQIRSVDNIPVVSWLARRGRCRACDERISPRYPATEAATAALFVSAAIGYQDDLYLAVTMALFFAMLLAVSLVDLEHKIIPNRIVYPAAIVFPALMLLGALMGKDLSPAHEALGAVAYGGGLFLVWLVYPKGMGMGDVKLAVVIGAVLGALGLELVPVAAMLTFFLGALGGVLAVAVGTKGRKSTIPFGPFMAAGAVLAALLGAEIADWYLGLFT